VSIVDEPKIDCHNHVFDPGRWPHAADVTYRSAGQEVGTAALRSAVLPVRAGVGSDWPFLLAPERIDYGPLLTLVERLVPDPADRRKLWWDTPHRLFGFGVPSD
jgi:predicted TIM-barrel fold metal-dependent hydrolase